MTPVDAEGLLEGLDDNQRRAVSSTAQPLRVLAGAGSGKTRVLTRRIAYRAAVGDIDPRKVLALTFTRKAAAELGHRLEALGLRDRPVAGTFHAVALHLLQTWWASTGAPQPVVLDRKAGFIRRMLARTNTSSARAQPGVRVSDAVGEIEWAKARLIPPTRYPAAADAAGRRVADPNAIADVYRSYEAEKRRRRVLDFDDLLLRCLEAMTRDHAFADAQRWRHRHLFVDEFQDVNPLQFRLLQAWLGDRTDLCVVGDPAQAIYRWNGADASFLIDFVDLFPGAETIELVDNYRSSPQILTAAARVLGRGPALVAHRPEGADVVVARYDSDDDEAAGIAWAVREQQALGGREGGRWSSQAVLVRTNAQVALVEQAFREGGIPYRVRGSRPFNRRREIRDALAAAHRSRDHLTVWLADLETALGASDGTESDRGDGLEQLVRLGHELVSVDPDAPANALPAWVATTLGSEDEDGSIDAVELSTFHAAKGLEWSVVHIAGVEAGLVPITHAADHHAVAEERRLLYVASTRAQHLLRVTWAQRRTFGTRTVKREPSPWLHALGAAKPSATVTGQRGRAPLTPSGRIRAAAVRAAAVHARSDVGDVQKAVAALHAWRARAARAAGVPPAVVLPDRVLHAIAERRPREPADLEEIPGLGPVLRGQWGSTLIAVLADVGGILDVTDSGG